jgi:peptide/nickel transport system substrate-binding protein
MYSKISVKRMISIILMMIVLLMFSNYVFGQTEKTYGGTVIIGLKGDFDSFNELNASDSDALQVISEMLFMSLTRLDENLKIVPYLAESWKFSEGGRILTYSLRKNVNWSDGIPTTSEDVLFTYQMAIHPDVAYPASSRFDLTEKVEVLDNHKICFHFKKAYPDALFDTQIPILPKHILEKISPDQIHKSYFNRNPVGNGPFQLVEWKANRHVIFKSNDGFSLGRPFLDQVIFSIIPDESVLFSNLMIGDIDLIPSISKKDFKKIEAKPKLERVQYSGRGYTFLAWNCVSPLFNNRIRRALSYSIDKEEIIATLLEGYAEPAIGPLMPFVWAFDKDLKGISYDIELAKGILNGEGWFDTDGDGILDKEGQDFEFTILTNAGSQLRQDVAVMIQAQLKKVGLKVKVDVVEFNLLLEKVFAEKDFDALLSAWDADFTVNPFYLWHSSAYEDGYNFIKYENKRVDFLLEKGREIIDKDKARPYWYEFQEIIIEDCPYTFLFIRDKLAVYNKRIKDVKMDVRGFLSGINKWWISD